MKNKLQKNKIHFAQNSRGFTLIEVLIAVSIFAASLAALLLTVGTGIGDVTVAKNKVVADYLAQEGVELVRYQRDYFAETDQANGWGDFQSEMNAPAHCIGTDQSGANQCGVSSLALQVNPETTPADCSGTNVSKCQIVEDSAVGGTGAYDIFGDTASTAVQSWEKTPFVRYIYLEPLSNANIPGGQAYIIHSVVKWSEGTGTYTTEMTDIIYNWF